MRVAMFTNTYHPLLGGVERAVATTAAELRRQGHPCLVVAPSSRGAPPEEADVVRVPAIESLLGTGFSYRLPGAVGRLHRRLARWPPDLVHVHHPFMLGDTGLRVARSRGLPLVFTSHTRWERFLPAASSPLLRRLARQLPVAFANVCDLVLAPTPSIARLLRRRGIVAPMMVVPSGIDVGAFAGGDRERGRSRWGIAAGQRVVGYVGRLVPEKNLGYLAEAALSALAPAAGSAPGVFLLVGEGPQEASLRRRFSEAATAGPAPRLMATGRLEGEPLADAYAAMDVFAFGSRTDTQGLVLVEAMAAGCPVVALDSPGPRDLVDCSNGVLLPGAAPADLFAAALQRCLATEARGRFSAGARQTASGYDLPGCTERLLAAYATATPRARRRLTWAGDAPAALLRRWSGRLVAEWHLLAHKAALASLLLR
jgi:glycosyltransferase involved in cell wall biosynthesis